MIRPPKFGRSWWDRGCDCLVTQEVWRGSECLEYQKSSSIFMTHFSYITRVWIFPFPTAKVSGIFPMKGICKPLEAKDPSRSSGRVWMLFRNENSAELAIRTHLASHSASWFWYVKFWTLTGQHPLKMVAPFQKKSRSENLEPENLKVNQVNHPNWCYFWWVWC